MLGDSEPRRAGHPSDGAVPGVAGVTEQSIVVLFTDLVGSTRLLTSLGAAGPETIALQHLGARQTLVEHCSGRVIKNTGDGVMAVMPSAKAAMDCGVAIQREMDAAAPSDPVGGRVVRIGITAGDAFSNDGDWFGACVIEAARLCAAAK